MKRPFPHPPHDPLQQEWKRPKSYGEWSRYSSRGPAPLRDLIADFCRWTQYFCAADLAYIDAGVMERPEPAVIIALEHAASDLDNDSELLAALWVMDSEQELGGREARWEALTNLMLAFARIDKERANGSA